MSKRRDNSDPNSPPVRKLRVLASGTLFLTHTLSLHSYPEETSVVRAQAVQSSRGGSASNVLCTLGQFPGVHAMLVAPLGGNDEAKGIIRDLESEGVSTKYCKIWEGATVPTAWVLKAESPGSRTVINHNPLPDITHEDFVSLLGPLLVPENYSYLDPAHSPRSGSFPSSHGGGANTVSPAPFDWLHLEGRSVKTSLSNITGIDGLARERKWRSHCVFSLDATRKDRQGLEALIPYADVIFFSKQYALSQWPNYTTPRPFLLSMTSIAAPHALLIVHWGSSGAALLSLPTREYLQSSGWVDETLPMPSPNNPNHIRATSDSTTQDGSFSVQSVRSGSGFWAAGHKSGSHNSSGAFTAFSSQNRSGRSGSGSGLRVGSSPLANATLSYSQEHDNDQYYTDDPDADHDDDGDNDSQGTETGRKRTAQHSGEDSLEDPTAQDAFMAGMIYALSRRILPGAPYTPSSRGKEAEPDRGPWKLEDCLRFASELAVRKTKKKGFSGLAEEMMSAGWFHS